MKQEDEQMAGKDNDHEHGRKQANQQQSGGTTQSGQRQSDPQQPAAVPASGSVEAPGGGAVPPNVAAALQLLAAMGGVPVNFTPVPFPRIDTGARLTAKPRLTILFPPCADVLLSLIHTDDQDEITTFFKEYFQFRAHTILGQSQTGNPPQTLELESMLGSVLDLNLLACTTGTPPVGVLLSEGANWPTDCCVCRPCVTLDGNRNGVVPRPPLPNPVIPSLKRLFIGDLVWLFHMEALGIFQVLGVILDAFAHNGSIPISNGTLDPADVRDDIAAVILEVMVQMTKRGDASSVRERASAYRTSLGWNSMLGRKLKLDTQVNSGFNKEFHNLIYQITEFHKDLRLAVAVRGIAAPAGPTSIATLTTISDTIDVLKKRFEAWEYGRNMYHTLNGIVWTIAGMSIIRELRSTLGIPPAYNDPHEYIPAAYDLLVAKRAVTHGAANRYVLHRELAKNGRDILLDLEVIDHLSKDTGGELENWLMQIEGKVESYRTAYRTATGVDLGVTGSPAIEQQA
jgi:hypothetical protein